MASYTTNLNLKKPAGSENVSIGDINNNMELIDSAYGTLNSKINILSANTDAISDCDSISTTGIYKAVNSTLNTPVANNHYVIYHVQYSQSEAYQIAIAVGVRLFIRTYQGTWSSWSEK